MEASTALGGTIEARSPASLLSGLARTLVVALGAMLLLTGLVVAARRAAGALSVPLSPLVLAGLGIALATLACAFRRAFAEARVSRVIKLALWAAPTAVLLLWAGAVSLAGSDPVGLVALFGALLLEEGYSWGRWPRAGQVPPRRDAGELPATTPAELPAPAAGEFELLDAERDAAVTQHVVRRQPGTGETIEGWLRCDFEPAQRHATAHLAICPPLVRVPECFAEQMDGPSARIRVAQVLVYGVRFEIRLDQPADEACGVFVEFSIQEPADDEQQDR